MNTIRDTSEAAQTFIEDDGDIFHCGRCDLNFRTFPSFLAHKNDQHRTSASELLNVAPNEIPKNCPNETEENRTTCPTCKRQFSEQLDLFLHMQSHSKERPHQCVICGRIFSQKSNVKKHTHSHRVWPNGFNKTIPERAIGECVGYSCPYCKTVTENYPKFKTHLKSHECHKRYKCVQGKCTSSYKDVNMLISHVENDHPIQEYRCHVCSLTTSSLVAAQEHQQTHAHAIHCSNRTRKTFLCTRCGSLFRSENNLNRHLEMADHASACEHCGKRFSTEKALRRHLVSHDSRKRFVCDTCDASFRRKHHLVSHMTTHSAVNSFACSVCSLKLSRRDVLVRHMRSHSNGKGTQCPLRLKLGCKMEFARSDKLKLHIKSHMRKMAGKNPPDGAKSEDRFEKNVEIIVLTLSSDSNARKETSVHMQ